MARMTDGTQVVMPFLHNYPRLYKLKLVIQRAIKLGFCAGTGAAVVMLLFDIQSCNTAAQIGAGLVSGFGWLIASFNQED